MPAEANAIKAVFLEALDKGTPAERAAFLDEACAGNAELRSKVESLLQLHDRPDALLDQPAAEHLATATSVGSPRADTEVALDFLEPSTKPDTLGRLGHYDVLEVVGHGGMGVVLRAFDEKLRRVVAIKVLAPALAGTESARRRFVREARAAAAVTHEHVVNIYAVEDGGPVPYLVMQFIQGRTLQDKLDSGGTLPLTAILRIGLQIAEGLAGAHRQGLIHRDIKPANILLENGVERVKITDFGLARAVDDAILTTTGVIAGTPAYMSPEQADGAKVDHRSDLFSLGSVLYTMCAGHPPFCADTTMGVLKRVCEDTPRPLREINPDIPDWLEAIVARLHSKDPADRFATAEEVASLLSRGLTHVQSGADPGSTLKTIVPRRRHWTARRWAGIAALLAVMGGGGAWWFLAGPGATRPDVERQAPDEKQATTVITLSKSTIPENNMQWEQVGTFYTSTPKGETRFAYSLVDGPGSENNGNFAVDTAGNLFAKDRFDFETKSWYSIRVRSTGENNLSLDKVFIIRVTQVNRAPTDIALSNNSINEQNYAYQLVGDLSTTAPNSGDTFKYTLVSGPGSDDNLSFAIDSAGKLLAVERLEFATKSMCSIRIRSTDRGGLFVEKTFTIRVTKKN
jgi:hypothetical protein